MIRISYEQTKGRQQSTAARTTSRHNPTHTRTHTQTDRQIQTHKDREAAHLSSRISPPLPGWAAQQVARGKFETEVEAEEEWKANKKLRASAKSCARSKKKTLAGAAERALTGDVRAINMLANGGLRSHATPAEFEAATAGFDWAAEARKIGENISEGKKKGAEKKRKREKEE